MIYFHDDPDNNEHYLTWLDHHPNGFVLNVSAGRKQRAMLHTGRCGHLYPPTPTLEHTKKPKACSEHRDELEGWAADKELRVSLCPDCKV